MNLHRTWVCSGSHYFNYNQIKIKYGVYFPLFASQVHLRLLLTSFLSAALSMGSPSVVLSRILPSTYDSH